MNRLIPIAISILAIGSSISGSQWAAASGDVEASSILLSQIAVQSMTFLGNASFGRTGGQIELTNPLLPKSDDDEDPNNVTSSGGIGGASVGKALYNAAQKMLDPPSSFDSTFAFAMSAQSQGLGFVISPNNQDLGQIPSRHGFSVEIKPSGSISLWSAGESLATANASFDLAAGARGFCWIRYDCSQGIVEVRASNLSIKPAIADINQATDLSPVFNEFMFVGFIASALPSIASRNTIYAWNFTKWVARSSSSRLNPDPAPVAASRDDGHHRNAVALTIAGLLVGSAIAIAVVVAIITVKMKYLPKSRSFKRLDQDQHALHRFTHKELAAATKNFSEKLGENRSSVSRCFKGVFSDNLVAIKVISNDPTFAIESQAGITTLAGLPQHRNVVRLLGWCSSDTRGSILVYEFIANGSLDHHLFNARLAAPLPWSHRHKIACGLAAALEHLHSRNVVHGNVKPSNIMLDTNFTARLGDFGVICEGARGGMVVAGTFGYIAPEAVQTGRSSTQADVFALGAVLLELVCGRRALEQQEQVNEDVASAGETSPVVDVLVDRVWDVFKQGRKLEQVVDPKLGGLFDPAEMEVMVRVGLACSHMDPVCRPNMETVVQILAGAFPPPMLEKEEAELKRPIEEVITIGEFNSILAGVGASSSSFNRLLV